MIQQFYSLMSIYLDKTFIEKDTCTPLFLTVLVTIAKTWKQCKCPLTEEWTKKIWYKYTLEYYLAIERNVIMPLVATWTDLEFTILGEVSHTEKDKYIISLTCGIKKVTQVNIFAKWK